MTDERGFRWAVYQLDDGSQFALRVDALYFADPVRGWLSAADGTLPLLPRTWRARRAVGVDATGRRQYALIGSLSAPLWNGEATEFEFEASDQTLQVARVVRLERERTHFAPVTQP